MSNALFRVTSYISCAILLSQCTTVTNSNNPTHHQASNPYGMSADADRTLANHQDGGGKNSLPLLTAGQLQPAQEVLSTTTPPKRIALLLPLTGPLAGPGGAIRDGFMAAYTADKAAKGTKIDLYDTNVADAGSLYGQALDEGAECIVGPLTKTDVAAVAKLDHPVPTVLLNDVNTTIKENAYQFGLSPSNEAKQVADKLHNDAHNRVLVIAPSGTWGEEVVQAFSAQLQVDGGRVVDTWYYGAYEDLNKSVKRVLQISSSEQRGKDVKKLLGYHIETSLMRRQDFDSVFLLAYPSKARQIMPLLQYYYANDVPVYATSTVYAGNSNIMKDKDLDGIRFCDMPWVFKHPMTYKNWPEQLNSYNRLYALGMDSYALAVTLDELQTIPSMGAQQKSGTLYRNPNQQIGRTLAWAEFKKGNAQPL